MITINISSIFNELRSAKMGMQKKISIDNCVLRMYCAISSAGNCRLSILTENPIISIESTKSLKVIQGIEGTNSYWTCFELLDNTASNVFYSLCTDLIDSALYYKSESEAMASLTNRYYAWRVMFKKSRPLSEEKIKGLFGELYFLHEYMIPLYGAEIAVNSWSGPDGTSKDFSVNELWYEIKTISTNAQVVKISSLAQLSADTDGQLYVVRTEKMSKEFNNGKCSINDLFNLILNMIKSNEVKEKFIIKLIDFGFDITDNSTNYKLKVDSVWSYLISDRFPRLIEKDVVFEEIGRVTYELILKSIDKFRIRG